MKENSFLAQDLNNQFRSMFFQNGNYENTGFLISSISAVWGVGNNEMDNNQSFTISYGSGLFQSFDYDCEQECRQDRNRLLGQIERFYIGLK